MIRKLDLEKITDFDNELLLLSLSLWYYVLPNVPNTTYVSFSRLVSYRLVRTHLKEWFGSFCLRYLHDEPAGEAKAILSSPCLQSNVDTAGSARYINPSYVNAGIPQCTYSTDRQVYLSFGRIKDFFSRCILVNCTCILGSKLRL